MHIMHQLAFLKDSWNQIYADFYSLKEFDEHLLSYCQCACRNIFGTIQSVGISYFNKVERITIYDLSVKELFVII